MSYAAERNIQRHWWSKTLTLLEYYDTPHWIKKRYQKLSKRPFCEDCGQRAVQVHHLRYYRWVIDIWGFLIHHSPLFTKKPIFFHERLYHLVSLCIECHKLRHGLPIDG